MRKKLKQLIGILLSLVMVLGLMPGMSLTTLAWDGDPYASLVNTTTVVKFDGREWYLIEDDSTAVNAGTVTLLSKECVKMSAYNSYGTFVTYDNNPTIKGVVDTWYSSNITANAKTAVTGNGMFLLTKAQADNINQKVRKCSQYMGAMVNAWWLCSPGGNLARAMCVDGENGEYYDDRDDVTYVTSPLGVRPALKLNLESVTFSSESNTFTVESAASYSVTVTAGSNMTWTTTSGAESQTGVTSVITDVVYTANDGYYFPENYSVTPVNGISVTRNSYTQITVSGTPSADAEITLTAPTEKTTPSAPTSAAAVNCTTADNNDGKLTGVTTAMEYQKSGAAEWTAGTGSDITGLVPGTYYVRYKETDTTNASTNQELTIAQYTAPTYTVTYKVVNGTWSDDSTTDKTETVQSGSSPASVPTGMKASSGYTGGSWDKNPADTTITEATTFTYTFTEKQKVATPSKKDDSKSKEKAHTHHYVWETIEATEDSDGELRYKCDICGDIQTIVPITAYYVFNKNTTDKIRKAGQGATVKIETSCFISFHKMVMDALAERPDVTLEISFLDGGYKGNRVTVTIPAGTDTLSLLDENGFVGFLYLASKMDALAERPDVTFEISFLDGEYKGNRVTVTIPAGTDALSLLDENDFVGFLYLASKYGYTLEN